MGRTSIMLAGIVLCTLGGEGHAAEPPKAIATGEWSKAVADTRGFAVRGRLVLCEKVLGEERREVAVYVEFQDARDSVGGEATQIFCDFGRTDFRPEYTGGLKCELRGKDNHLVKSTSYPFSGAVPKSEWVTLPSDATIRLRASPFGIHRIGAMAISPDPSNLWVIENDDSNEYFLSGTFTVDPSPDRKPPSEGHVWRGTLELPAVRISQPRKLKLVNHWVGQLDEMKLTELLPAKGYITGEANWKKLWTAWRPSQAVPLIDFTKHLMLVNVQGNYHPGHEVRLTDQGDLQIRVYPRVSPKLTIGYGIAQIDRTGVRTIQGKTIEPD